MKIMAMNYRTRLIDDLRTIGADAWDKLVQQQAAPTPFLSYAFLSALHETGCATPATGWTPQFLTLWDDTDLVAAMPLYRKDHSYGEYVFDWAWADAYQRHGLAYYPKLLSAIPFTPVAGTRLLARDATARAALISALQTLIQAASDAAALHASTQGHAAFNPAFSSAHILYPTEAEADALTQAGFMPRTGVQFHWHNPGYASFEDFLGHLEQKKRKNIRAEQRKVAEAGVTFRRIRGQDASAADWAFFTRCYQHTYRAHFSTPYLNLAFFERIGHTMPQHLLLIVAQRQGVDIASSLLVYSQTDAHSVLYGRYWGALDPVPCLHFETSYYQPQAFCIDEDIAVFEGGAQGEHKMARGFLPVVTYSAHWLAHPAFADAVARFLAQEKQGIHEYVGELSEHNPFKAQAQ